MVVYFACKHRSQWYLCWREGKLRRHIFRLQPSQQNDQVKDVGVKVSEQNNICDSQEWTEHKSYLLVASPIPVQQR